MSRLTRRDALRLVGALSVGGLAGCADGSSSGADDRPTTGDHTLGPFDRAMAEFMDDHTIPGGVLAVAKDGAVVHERGYGYRDADRTDPMVPDTQLRIASLSKVFTRAAVRTLVRQDRLALAQPVFPLLGLDPLPGESFNTRLDGITVRHLLDHRGGWDREASYDPLFVQLDIALERGWDQPPAPREIARYMLSEPLQFGPGESVAYSNFGYMVLALVVEELTGTDYQSYLDRELFDPHGISDIEPGRSLPADRPDRETWYFDEMACRNTVKVQPLELVRCPDGGFHQEATIGAGEHIATARSLLRFMRAYWLNGRPREGDQQIWSFNGTLPGTFSMAFQHTDGVDVAVIFNQRGYDPNYLAARRRLLDALDAVERWPV